MINENSLEVKDQMTFLNQQLIAKIHPIQVFQYVIKKIMIKIFPIIVLIMNY